MSLKNKNEADEHDNKLRRVIKIMLCLRIKKNYKNFPGLFD